MTRAGARRNDGSGPARGPAGAARTSSATLAIFCTKFALAQHIPEAVLDTVTRAADIDAHKRLASCTRAPRSTFTIA